MQHPCSIRATFMQHTRNRHRAQAQHTCNMRCACHSNDAVDSGRHIRPKPDVVTTDQHDRAPRGPRLLHDACGHRWHRRRHVFFSASPTACFNAHVGDSVTIAGRIERNFSTPSMPFLVFYVFVQQNSARNGAAAQASRMSTHVCAHGYALMWRSTRWRGGGRSLLPWHGSVVRNIHPTQSIMEHARSWVCPCT